LVYTVESLSHDGTLAFFFAAGTVGVRGKESASTDGNPLVPSA
jgi:hypothetical protein